MNIVLFTSDFEPITVLDLPMWALDRMRDCQKIRLAVPEPMNFSHWDQQMENSEPKVFKTIVIYSELLMWKGHRKQIIVTDHDENALLLRPSWLPGQVRDVQRMQKEASAFAELLCRALGGGNT